jgi:hypothetical protein
MHQTAMYPVRTYARSIFGDCYDITEHGSVHCRSAAKATISGNAISTVLRCLQHCYSTLQQTTDDLNVCQLQRCNIKDTVACVRV